MCRTRRTIFKPIFIPIYFASHSQVEKKQKAIKEAQAFKFNDDSISKMVEEKEKFRKNPINYAMRKTRLQKMLEMAQTNGESDKADELKSVRSLGSLPIS